MFAVSACPWKWSRMKEWCHWMTHTQWGTLSPDCQPEHWKLVFLCVVLGLWSCLWCSLQIPFHPCYICLTPKYHAEFTWSCINQTIFEWFQGSWHPFNPDWDCSYTVSWSLNVNAENSYINVVLEDSDHLWLSLDALPWISAVQFMEVTPKLS